MERLIDADVACKGCVRYGTDLPCEDCVVKDAPTVDAVEVVHGYWVSDKADILFHCSVCETQISTDWDYDDLSWNYCPNCGAKMDGDADA